MGEAKIFKEYLKGEIENFEEFKWVKLHEMLDILYMALRRSSLFVNKHVAW
jgi:hypothetical protein